MEKIGFDLKEEDLLQSYAPMVFGFSAPRVLEYWKHRLRQDPFYFLTSSTRLWIEDLLDRLGRKFLVDDFEGIMEDLGSSGPSTLSEKLFPLTRSLEGVRETLRLPQTKYL